MACIIFRVHNELHNRRKLQIIESFRWQIANLCANIPGFERRTYTHTHTLCTTQILLRFRIMVPSLRAQWREIFVRSRATRDRR